jgi:hypothetical protein
MLLYTGLCSLSALGLWPLSSSIVGTPSAFSATFYILLSSFLAISS